MREIAAEQVERLAEVVAALGPTDGALAIAARTIDELTGGPVRPPAWDLATYVLKGAGRLPLDEDEREFLGERAGQFPALG